MIYCYHLLEYFHLYPSLPIIILGDYQGGIWIIYFYFIKKNFNYKLFDFKLINTFELNKFP